MAEAAKVVELKRGQTVDLRKDNRIGDLLDEYEEANAAYLEAKRLRDELKEEIITKMAGAETALVDGWRLRNQWQHRKEFVMKAVDFQVLRMRRIRKPPRRGNLSYGGSGDRTTP